MTLHKLTAGDGYTYLTRQVAAHDVAERGFRDLGDYYAQRGESPGRWLGAGLASIGVSGTVGEAQMRALFGEGRHPDADAIELAIIEQGGTPEQALKASALGRAFPVYRGEAGEFRRLVAERFAGWNAGRGLPRDWPVPAEEKARIRTATGRELFAREYGRPPADDRELAGFVARGSRQATTAVAGYDLTFSPVKSVSTLWAIAPTDVARRIEAAHDTAVGETLAWLEREAAFTREGPAGVRQVPVRGLLAVAFTHRDSRAGDPDLHTHVAVSNKVQTVDGRWLALDGRVLHKAAVSASEYYDSRLEAHLAAGLGVWFAPREAPQPGRRAIREVAGVDPRLAARWSSRRVQIESRRAELAGAFQRDHGRPPTPVEAIALAQQANLETRAAKHAPRSLAEQRGVWRAEAVATLGGPDAVAAMVAGALRYPQPASRAPTAGWVDTAATHVVATVSAARASWQYWHVRAEALRAARAASIGTEHVAALVDAALALCVPIGAPDSIDEPDALRRPDGTSVYTVARSQLYTSAGVLAAEQAIVAAAQRRDGRTIAPQAVEITLLETAANRTPLTPGQASLVRELATSGARVQLALAPAGTGKTTALATLARAWTGSGGHIVGLAPSAAAATVLRDAIAAPTDTLAKLCHALGVTDSPDWVAAIGPDTLVIIDEAGLAGTPQLAQAIAFILDRGASVRLIADDRQLAAVGAGGVLADLAHTTGAITLSQVVRFTDPAEGAASLAVRNGDEAGIGYYLDKHRVHVGDRSTAIEQAYQAWAADRTAGHDALLLAPTRRIVTELNARARADRLGRTPPSRQVPLADGLAASVGDTVITRRNDRRLAITAVDFVKNGDRWHVERAHPDGSLDVRHLRLGTTITLPAGYVHESVELGYATTTHAAQGITADTTHTVLTGDETRRLLYVALTRGRHANHLYLATAGDGDPHTVIRAQSLRPPTAADLLTTMLRRDDATPSASTVQRAAAAPAQRLRDAAARYTDALAVVAEHLAGTDLLDIIDADAATLRPGLTAAPAYPTLRSHLALLALDGHDPAHALRHVTSQRELDTADDPAAVLDWRLPDPPNTAPPPLPWLPGLPQRLIDHPTWGRYLTARAGLIHALAAEVADEARGFTPASAPAWAKPVLETDPDLVADLAVWRAAAGIPDDDRRPTGPPQQSTAASAHQRTLDERVHAALGDPATITEHWAQVAGSVEPRITADQYWPELARRLHAADRAGIDVAHLLARTAAEAPLPDEHPAAALWWRMTRHLGPSALDATEQTAAGAPDPEWAYLLEDILDTDRASRVRADPAWPALVAAVDAAGRHGWPADTLLATAASLATDRHGQPVPAPDLAETLIWRIAMLTDADLPTRDRETQRQPHVPAARFADPRRAEELSAATREAADQRAGAHRPYEAPQRGPRSPRR